MKSVGIMSTDKGISALLAAVWGVIISPMPLLVLLTIIVTIAILSYGMWKSPEPFLWSRWLHFTMGSLFGYTLTVLLGTGGVLVGVPMQAAFATLVALVALAGTQIMTDYKIAPPWVQGVREAIRTFMGDVDGE